MKYLSFVLLTLSFCTTAQRVEFNDPDLTFSFVKPEAWIVQDGPTIFVVPEEESLEKSHTFFSITYFEQPIQTEVNEDIFDANELEPSIPSDLIEFKTSETGRKYIVDQTALWVSYFHTKKGIKVKVVSYVFMKLNQRFEIVISAPSVDFNIINQQFQSIIASLVIKE